MLLTRSGLLHAFCTQMGVWLSRLRNGVVIAAEASGLSLREEKLLAGVSKTT